ncbi:MAG: proteasome subunit beta [Candidatus Lokiarchaeota archaeon]|nr:proteasome subunit beta [Candidatus Lokiarchaeota archaeon]
MMNNSYRPDNIDEEYLKKIQSGTTTVGLVVKDGVVVGTESQASAGYLVASKQAQKLFEINKYTCATISGGVADAQYVVNQIKALSRLKEVEEGVVPEPKYVANVTRNILFSGRSYYLAMMIIGGYSLKDGEGKLYGIDLLGALFEERKFVSYGSGSPFSLGVLEADWKTDMSREEGIDLIKTAITSSRERDAASGYKIQICSISKDGFQQVQ